MWSDNETVLDLLNIDHYVSSVVELATDEELLPVTIGIFGDWGGGKSSLLKMVKAKLDEHEKTLCLYFNGWLFEDYDDAKAALMGTILDEIGENPKLSTQAKQTLDNLRKRVNWFGLMGVAGKYGLGLLLGGPIGGVGAIAADVGGKLLEKAKEGKIDDIKTLVKDTVPDSTEVRKNIHEFKEGFGKLLDESKIERLVVIIDDLDRCLPDTIINTLEAIKLFLSSKNTAFLISIDERVIKYAINVRYSNFDTNNRDEISRDYLEKLIQIPLKVPLMNKSEMKSYINLLFASKRFTTTEFDELLKKVNESRQGANFNVSIDVNWFKANAIEKVKGGLDEELMITEQINDLLYDFLKGNPRQVKRFINALLLRINLARLHGVELNKQILAKLMALEYMHIEHFRMLADWQGAQSGHPKEIKELEDFGKENNSESDSSNYKKWLQNSWIKRWLNSEPSLADVNFEPYFYISRDSLSYFSTPSIELSESEKGVFENLVSSSKAQRLKGSKDFKELNEIEASRVVKALTDRITKTDPNTDNGDLLGLFASLPNLKIEVADTVIDCLYGINEKSIPPSVVPELKRFQQSTTPELNQKIEDLFEKFRKSENQMLVKAVDA